MGHGRLGRAIERANMGTFKPTPAVDGVLDFAAAPAPQAQQIGPEQLVPLLLQSGQIPAYQIRVDAKAKVICLIACLGPLQIPLPFDVEQGRKVAGELAAACDQAEAPPDPPAEPESSIIVAA